ncbi:hypothetical protein Tco_0648492 [Tanacetum coccineum]
MGSDISYCQGVLGHLNCPLCILSSLSEAHGNKLEIDKDVVGNDMTTAEHLIRFMKNQIADAQVSPV